MEETEFETELTFKQVIINKHMWHALLIDSFILYVDRLPDHSQEGVGDHIRSQ